MLSFFLLLVLLINPKIKLNTTENSKPILAVLKDKSSSINYFKSEQTLEEVVKKIESNSELNNKFSIRAYSFSDNISLSDSTLNSQKQTNISKAIQSVNELYKDKLGAIAILTDGNQTVGNDYEFVRSNKKIFPVVVGDTTQYQDVRISQLNVNKYNYIKNKFPVEALLHYNGKNSITTEFAIFHKGRKVFTKKVQLSPDKSTETVVANLESTGKGVQFYSAQITKINGEKNTKNNIKNFSVEVIDEQQKGLILASVLHPDLGALKRAIESDKKRSVTIETNLNKQINYSNYQFFILYQPDASFSRVLNAINSNFLVVTGLKTNWSFLNSKFDFSKSSINQSEDYLADYNKNFITFQQKDIDFNNFPPLKGRFGRITIQGNSQTLLHQKLQRFDTKQPLLSTFEKNDIKYAALFGEGIWKWRAAVYRDKESFEEFDAFIGSLMQYLASNKKRKRLEVTSERLYQANEIITISALYLDKNYVFDDRASLWLTLTNKETKEVKRLPMSLKGNSYQLNIEDTPEGDYSYKVSVDGQVINAYGRFKVSEYNVEEQFTNANVKKLQKLADNSGGKLFHLNQEQDLISLLNNAEEYYTTQKTIVKEKNLIDWKWILFLAVALLSLEWFIRKYYGKI
ncbi:hypothetical protein WH52_02195 [Tenacibaculum holothuriorum]|uniref:VWFA domain-containing protein n=1 Tax=Tenacibaculum holothuriorum TaxID=1635173 RepID=A0A1Y2PIS1_9FLAO|nr:hypothetical protein WH52_02195 [Tenacibaculum holothuriorum]